MSRNTKTKASADEVSVFDDAVSLKDYVHFQKRAGFGKSRWKFVGYGPEGKTKIWGCPGQRTMVYLSSSSEAYEAGIYETGPTGFARAYSKDLAMKLVRILQDYLPFYSFEKLCELRNKSLQVVVDSRTRQTAMIKQPPATDGAMVQIPDSLIRGAYGKTFDAVAQKYPIQKPQLRILHGKHTFYGDYAHGNNTIRIRNTLQMANLKNTLLHEIAHAIAWQNYSETGHKSHFLNIFKTLTGRDYFENQGTVLKELCSAELSGKPKQTKMHSKM